MLLKCLLITALVFTASCATVGKTKSTFLKRSSTADDGVVSLQTTWTSNGLGDVNYLAQHNIDCRSTKAGGIASFQLQRNENDQISYTYQCRPLSTIDWDQCAEQSTDTTDMTGLTDKTSAALLERRDVRCEASSVLTAFRLQPSTDGSQLSYTYTCCKAYLGKCGRDETATKDLARGGLINLDQQAVAAPAGNVLTGFGFKGAAATEEGVITSGYYKMNFCAAPAVTSRRTNPSTHGDGDIIYLDRHNVDCKSDQAGAISAFRMRRQGGDKIYYDYDCKEASSIDWNDCETKTTGWTEIGDNRKKSVNFLDRQNVRCSAGRAMTQFKFETNGPTYNRMRYNYTCCAAVFDVCSAARTSVQDLDEGYLVYLDRQNVKAQENRLITGFQFQTQYPGGGKMTGNYRVDSCLAQ